jgi:hypothetical protein
MRFSEHSNGLSHCPEPYGQKMWDRRQTCPLEAMSPSRDRSRPLSPLVASMGPPCVFPVRKFPFPPVSIPPCLPSPSQKAPSGSAWVHEIKHDGYRVMARRDGKRVRLFTRRAKLAAGVGFRAISSRNGGWNYLRNGGRLVGESTKAEPRLATTNRGSSCRAGGWGAGG